MYKVIALTLVGLALVVSAYGEIVNYESCTKTLNERNALGTVHEAEVTPCPDAPNGPCEITRGGTATFRLDFTPTVKPAGRRTRFGFFWQQSAIDLPFRGMNPRVCGSGANLMDCSLGANVRRNFTARIELKRSLPAVSPFTRD
jgi:hypothetical protein